MRLRGRDSAWPWHRSVRWSHNRILLFLALKDARTFSSGITHEKLLAVAFIRQRLQ